VGWAFKSDVWIMKRFPRSGLRKTPQGAWSARADQGARRTVFSHPDFLETVRVSNRRLRLLTGSADLPARAGSARGLVPWHLTAGGESHPALKTSLSVAASELAAEV
jgi:hypothetical protein